MKFKRVATIAAVVGMASLPAVFQAGPRLCQAALRRSSCRSQNSMTTWHSMCRRRCATWPRTELRPRFLIPTKVRSGRRMDRKQ